MSCGHLADGVRSVLGDGSSVGLRLRYLEEPRPLGTGGALKFAEDLLDERFLMLNGDTLTDLDLTAQLAAHEAYGRPRHAGAVPGRGPVGLRARAARRRRRRCASSSRSRRRTRSTPTTSPPARTCSSARCCRCWCAVSAASIERDVFPRLVGDGLYGHVSSGYWKDIGTPERYLRGDASTSSRATVATEVARADGRDLRVRRGRRRPPRGGSSRRRWSRAAAGSPRARGSAGARCSSTASSVGEGTTIESAVVMDGASIGAHCTLRGCIVAAGALIGDHCVIDGMSVIGEGVVARAPTTSSPTARGCSRA